MSKIKHEHLFAPILLMLGYLIVRLINQSKLIYTFPLDYTNDISSYIAQFFFLFKCGFHKSCPYWYNGVTTFLKTPPGWHFFFAPLYFLTKNILLTVYSAIIITLILGLIAFLLLAKTQKLSKIKGLTMFTFFFANPITLGNFIRLGRITSMLAWVWLIGLFVILLYYKDKKLDKYFLLIIPLYAILLITHYQEPLLLSMLIISLFLVKPLKEKLYLFISILGSLLIASFWIIPFLLNYKKGGLFSNIYSLWLLDFKGLWIWTNMCSVAVSAAFIILFYFYIKSKVNRKKEILFFLPILILWFLVTSRIIIFVPFFKTISPDPYTCFFFLFSLYFLMKSRFNKKILQIIFIGLILFAILSVVVSTVKTPWFKEHSQTAEDTLEALSYVDDIYIITGEDPINSYEKAFYSYTAIFMNISTSSGWCPMMTTEDYNKEIHNLHEIFDKKENCQEFIDQLNLLNTTYVLVYYEDNCKYLQKCLKNKVFEKGEVCLYSFKS